MANTRAQPFWPFTQKLQDILIYENTNLYQWCEGTQTLSL